MGAFLLWDSVTALLSFEHPSIGTVRLFGTPIWLGWLMLPALVWSAVPAALLGRAKLPLAGALHDKVLHADATMNKADWLTAGAAMVGVLGIGFGLWWADAVAASVICLDILHDGVRNLRTVVADLLDSQPTTVDHDAPDDAPERVRATSSPWTGSPTPTSACARRGTCSSARPSSCQRSPTACPSASKERWRRSSPSTGASTTSS